MVLGEYDIAVIGGGHAGCEAALAAARLGMKTVNPVPASAARPSWSIWQWTAD